MIKSTSYLHFGKGLLYLIIAIEVKWDRHKYQAVDSNYVNIAGNIRYYKKDIQENLGYHKMAL